MKKYRIYTRAASDSGRTIDARYAAGSSDSSISSRSSKGVTPVVTVTRERRRSRPVSPQKEPRIVLAIKRGDFSLVQRLLDADYDDVAEKGSDGMCALHWAAKLGQIDVLRLLLLRIDVDEPDEDDRTALFHAIDNDTEMPEVIDFLLEHGADASHRDNRATSALRLATEKGRVNTMRKLVKLDGTALLEAVQRCSEYDDAQSVTVKAVKALLDCGADINVRSEYSHDNVLHIAARTGCFAVFDLLQGSSQLIEETNTDGRTPLHVAADNSESIVRALVEQHSANIKAKTNENWTPLHFSARQSNTDLVSFLMDKGADLTARTDEGFTPAYFACLCQHDEVAATILERIIQEHTLSATGVGEDQGPLLMCAIIYGCFHVVKRLVQYATESGTNGKLSSEITPGWTPVLVALAMTRSDIANLLIENGASTEGSTPDGNTALHWASVNGMTEVVVGLLESHAGGDRLLTMPNNQGMVPLDCAAAGQHTDVVCLLLKRSDPQREIETPTDGWTALHWAAWYQRLDVIKCLIHNLADLSERDASNRTAFDIAKGLSTSSSEILKWLTLNNVHNAHISNPPLEKPVPEDTARDFCKQTSIYLMDVYPEAVMEKAGFTVFDVIYEWGPSPFMKMVANAQKIKGDLGFRWIHLPVNRKIWIKDLIQAIYFDKSEAQVRLESSMKVVGKTLRFELPHGRLETLQREFNGHNDIEDPEASISNGLDPEASTTDEPNWVRWLRMPKKPKGDRHGTTTTTRTESKVKKVPHYPHLRRFVDNFLERAAGIQPFHFMAPLFEGFEEQTIRGDYKYRIALSIPYFSFKRIGDVDQSSKVSPAAAQQYPVQISDLTGGVKTERSPIDPTTEYGPLLDGDVHMSLTLDQFYYNFMRNVDHRNTDQVLYRHQERMTPAPKQEDRRICMVNQCWVLITDDDTIVTSTSEHQDGISNTIQEAISNHFTRDEDKRPEVSSALDMIPLILSLCCRQTIELKLGVGGENLLQVFGSDIARAANREVELFDQFILGLKAPNQPLPSSQASHNDGILEEIELLKEVKDILDELNIIKAVLLDQREILTAAFETLEQWDQRIYFGRQRAKKTTHLGELLAYYQRFGKLDTIGMEVAKLIHDAGQTRENINHLLDLRQKHANLSEAISARTSSENTARQGRTILVFTVVTIIFLPITFLSSLFALNITSFPHDTAGNLSYSPQWAYSRLFGITVAVSVPLITLAFFMNHIVGFVSSFLVRIANSNGNQTRNAGIDTADIARRVIPASADADGIREKAEQEQIWRRTWRRRPSDVENRNSRLPASQGTDDQGTVRFSRRLSRTDSLQSSRRRVANSTPMVR